MAPILLSALAAGCASGAGPIAEPADDPVLVGLCDASAAVLVGRHLVVADDEHDTLRAYRVPGFAPAGAIALSALDPAFGGEETDLEGLATAPDGRVWAVGSHDPGKGTTPEPDRQRLFALRLTEGGEGVTAALDGPIDTAGAMLPPVTPGTEGRTAKDPLGRSIEALAWQGDGLVFGFRAPVRDGRAPLVRLGPAGPEATWVDTGGRGFRALDTDGDTLLALLGRDDDFVVAAISGDRAEVLGPAPPGLVAEGLVRLPDGWWVLSDDGRRELGGTPCRDLPAADRRARLRPLALPPR